MPLPSSTFTGMNLKYSPRDAPVHSRLAPTQAAKLKSKEPQSRRHLTPHPTPYLCLFLSLLLCIPHYYSRISVLFRLLCLVFGTCSARPSTYRPRRQAIPCPRYTSPHLLNNAGNLLKSCCTSNPISPPRLTRVYISIYILPLSHPLSPASSFPPCIGPAVVIMLLMLPALTPTRRLPSTRLAPPIGLFGCRGSPRLHPDSSPPS